MDSREERWRDAVALGLTTAGIDEWQDTPAFLLVKSFVPVDAMFRINTFADYATGMNWDTILVRKDTGIDISRATYIFMDRDRRHVACNSSIAGLRAEQMAINMIDRLKDGYGSPTWLL